MTLSGKTGTYSSGPRHHQNEYDLSKSERENRLIALFYLFLNLDEIEMDFGKILTTLELPINYFSKIFTSGINEARRVLLRR